MNSQHSLNLYFLITFGMVIPLSLWVEPFLQCSCPFHLSWVPPSRYFFTSIPDPDLELLPRGLGAFCRGRVFPWLLTSPLTSTLYWETEMLLGWTVSRTHCFISEANLRGSLERAQRSFRVHLGRTQWWSVDPERDGHIQKLLGPI